MMEVIMEIKKFFKEWKWKLRWSSTATSIPHFLAMNMPIRRLRVFFHKMRGTKIGKNVRIAHNVFIEGSRPWLVTIEDGVMIGPGVIIVTHDSSYYTINCEIPYIYGEVKICEGSYIGAGSIILSGVTIGKKSIVAAGSVVTKDVKPNTIVAGVPAKPIGIVEEKIREYKKDLKQLCEIAKKTRYPTK